MTYKEFETRTSYRYLKEVIHSLKEPICILGGWAVFFHVNRNFEKAQGRPYLGSRDIDLGFNISKDMTALSQTIKILTEKLKFKPLSFRLVKEIHTKTEEEISDGALIPAHFIFPMYVDLIVDSIPKDFKSIFHFDPIDEPLLKLAFDKKEYTLLKEFDKKLLLPNPELLMAMKINSLPGRDKEHKRTKDICDLFTLAWYANLKLDEINLARYISRKNLKICLEILTDESFEKAALQIGHEREELKRLISFICERK
jgi:hypothetical protein